MDVDSMVAKSAGNGESLVQGTPNFFWGGACLLAECFLCLFFSEAKSESNDHYLRLQPSCIFVGRPIYGENSELYVGRLLPMTKVMKALHDSCTAWCEMTVERLLTDFFADDSIDAKFKCLFVFTGRTIYTVGPDGVVTAPVRLKPAVHETIHAIFNADEDDDCLFMMMDALPALIQHINRQHPLPDKYVPLEEVARGKRKPDALLFMVKQTVSETFQCVWGRSMDDVTTVTVDASVDDQIPDSSECK
jgi:hypothetical protein